MSAIYAMQFEGGVKFGRTANFRVRFKALSRENGVICPDAWVCSPRFDRGTLAERTLLKRASNMWRLISGRETFACADFAEADGLVREIYASLCGEDGKWFASTKREEVLS